jgi:eukaryotic-like serine/threonine-protein kinase
MAETRICAKCGALLSAYAPAGLCANCMLQQGFDPVIGPASLSEAGGPTGPDTALAGLAPSTTVRYFGDYELLEEIARGGMGIVYRARQVSLNRVVAIKMLLSGPLSSPESVKRFRAEASAAASLQHPNIVAIHEVGVHDGHQYFAMDFVQGQSLARLLAAGPLPAKRAVAYLKTIAEAIHYAHERGLLHRDLKPSNVLIDEADQPRVTDFGLAKRLEGDLELTLSGQVLGSPNYMPPEQAGAKRGQLSRRSDVYALGAMLYHLLTGRPPFVGETIANTLARVIDSEPVTPRLLNPSVPRDLETLCLKCLEKEPGKRYPTAQVLVDELNRFLRGEPVQARPVIPLEKVWRWCRRNPKTAILGATVILLLFTVAIGSTLAAVRINRAERARTEELFHSYVAQAGSLRRNGHEGQRVDALALVAKAAAIRSSLELRSEAIACLAVTDIRFHDPVQSPDPDNESWDATLERRAYREKDGRISIRRIVDNSIVAVLPSVGAGHCWLGAMSPGGRYLAVSYPERGLVWDVEKQQPIITNFLGGIAADFGDDARSVILNSLDGQLSRFGLNPVQPLTSFAIDRRYRLLRLRPQGDWFTGCEVGKGDVELRYLSGGSLIRTFSHPSSVGSLAWSSDGTNLAVGCESGRVFIWNALTGENREFKAHQSNVESVGFSHSGRLLGSSGWDGEFRLWDLTTDSLLLTARGNSYQVTFSADDRRIGYVQRGSESGSLEILPSSICYGLHCQASPNRGSYGADISPDGRLVSAAFLDGVHIWADQQREAPFVLPAGVCYSAIFTPDGTNLITCGLSGLARWPMRRIPGAMKDELRIGPRQPLQDGLGFNYAALSLDGRWVAAAYPEAGAVSIYDVRVPTNHFNLDFQPRITYPSISPDGRWVAAGNFKTSGVKVWDFQSTHLVCNLPTPSSAWPTFSPDNRWLAVGGSTLDLVATGSWKRKYSLAHGRSDSPMALAFSPDSRTLAMAAEPGIVRLIAVDTGETLANLEAPGVPITVYLRFSADGSQLFALDWDQQVQVWDLRRIRVELRHLNLDWTGPPIPTETAPANPPAKPLQISLEDGSH